MTEQQSQEFFLFLQKFCSDNVGNRLNEWIIEAFLNRAHQRLGLARQPQQQTDQQQFVQPRDAIKSVRDGKAD